MSLAGDEYGRRTLDFVERVQRAQTHDEVRDLVIRELEWYGLPFVTSWSMPRPGDKRPEDVVALNTRPADYIEHYFQNNRVQHDPVITQLWRSLAPFTWEELKTTRKLNKTERFIIDEAKDFGANDGVVVPIVSANGSIGIFSACGLLPNLSQRARSALEIIGIYSYHALQRTQVEDRRQQGEQYIPLTPREREIMRWVATGKSDDEIAAILTIGRETVTTHVENAKRKLNAARRTYAVVQALRYGEISL
ncbi:MAG: autoinducer binding domain-containing protein [Methylovirgula sp.]